MNRTEILNLLPYGEPFLFIDSVSQLNKGKSIVTSMHYDKKHDILAAHFCKGPHIVPGAIISEQICQSVLLLGVLSGEISDYRGFFLGRVQSVYQAPAIVPCIITACVEFLVHNGDSYGFSGLAHYNDKQIARVSLVAHRINFTQYP